jgi:death on curing protein
MTEPVWLTADIIKAIQADLIQRFGGEPGLRDETQLDFIVERIQRLGQDEEAPDIYDLAACYAHNIAERRAFVDGNLRTAFAAADVFLRLNNRQINVPEPKIVLTFLDLAAGDLDEKALAKAIST